jgi:hypothetical protein
MSLVIRSFPAIKIRRNEYGPALRGHSFQRRVKPDAKGKDRYLAFNV